MGESKEVFFVYCMKRFYLAVCLYSCELSLLRKHMLCCSTAVSFTCPSIGQTPVVSQQGNNLFCNSAGQRDVCPINSLCLSAANSAGLLICCFSSPSNVQPICPNNGQPQSSLGGSFVSCDITNPTCSAGYTCVRASNDFQTTLCCTQGSTPTDPICPNQQTAQLTNGRPTYCNPATLSSCSSGFSCTAASNVAGTFICCSSSGTSTCPANFSPSLDNLGNQIFCTPTNTAGCPGGSQCLQSPNNNAFFLCCRSSISPRVCPNGQNALINSNGNLESCTGPGAPCSQTGYTCTLSPVLAQYFCCGAGSSQLAVCADGRDTYQQVSGQVYTCSPLQLPTGCPVGYDCAQSSVLGTYVCCRTAATTVSPQTCPSGWNAYRNEVTGETRTCTGPFDMSCPIGFSCTPANNMFAGSSAFVCCRLATALRCISGQPLLLNNQPRLCSTQQLNQCPPSYTCQQSTIPSITICCTNIPFPLSRDSSQFCPDGSQAALIGTTVQYCTDVGTQSSCPTSHICQQNVAGRNLCCRVTRARISSSKLAPSALKETAEVCGPGTISQMKAGVVVKCADQRDCEKPFNCLESPTHSNASFCCQRARCPSGVQLSAEGRLCTNDGDCGVDAQCQRAVNMPKVSVCCAVEGPATTRCEGAGTLLVSGRPGESVCDKGYECSSRTSTARAVCCARATTVGAVVCPPSRVPFYVSMIAKKLLYCDDTGYMCPLDFECLRSADLDRFLCCSPLPRCPGGTRPVEDEGAQIRCTGEKDCPAGSFCRPSSVSNHRICCGQDDE
ncbi:unnamed protein product, partial [Mesorhabditis spiculigera]